MAKKTTKSSVSAVKMGVVGAGIAALAGTAYFFLGPKGKAHQKHAKSWVIKMKGDVIEQLEKARDVSEPTYHAIIDAIAEKYKKGMEDGGEEVALIAQDLKKHWKILKKGVK